MMVSSAMWYGTENRSTVTFKFKVGLLSIGWNEFYVGCVTVLTGYPVVWILSEFFRRSKMRKYTIDKTEAKLNILDEGIVKELPKKFSLAGVGTGFCDHFSCILLHCPVQLGLGR